MYDFGLYDCSVWFPHSTTEYLLWHTCSELTWRDATYAHLLTLEREPRTEREFYWSCLQEYGWQVTTGAELTQRHLHHWSPPQHEWQLTKPRNLKQFNRLESVIPSQAAWRSFAFLGRLACLCIFQAAWLVWKSLQLGSPVEWLSTLTACMLLGNGEGYLICSVLGISWGHIKLFCFNENFL